MMPSVLLFFNISGGEIAIIALLIFIVLGPEKMPDIARKFGKTMRYIRKATDDIKREINIDEDIMQKSSPHTKKTTANSNAKSASPVKDTTSAPNTKTTDNK
ncbi:MAG: twin-arginine translocase TatA/TatE family subunit [Bacteroidetes bacterium]|nr:MAG: twin-arginine translocase TatA/TatE family subunit [Bacteroidota bacterium]